MSEAAADRPMSTKQTPAPKRSTQATVAHALLLGERLKTTGLVDHNGVVATAPLAYRIGETGLVALFRYGAVVLFGLTPDEEGRAIGALAERVIGPEPHPEEETATLVIEPDADEQITSSGAIQLRTASVEHLLIVADVLAKSVALARDERQVAAVFDAVEPYAAGLAGTGRPPRGRGPILRLIGRALLVQHRVSGRVAVREKPDILWDRPDLGRLYGRLEDEYELIERAETLDRKLTVIAGATTALIDLKDTARSLRLELIIILLILAELIVGLVELFGRHG
jgi:uncharacterized Rmd1/YagE family protein